MALWDYGKKKRKEDSCLWDYGTNYIWCRYTAVGVFVLGRMFQEAWGTKAAEKQAEFNDFLEVGYRHFLMIGKKRTSKRSFHLLTSSWPKNNELNSRKSRLYPAILLFSLFMIFHVLSIVCISLYILLLTSCHRRVLLLTTYVGCSNYVEICIFFL